ncbi:hypothetical protein FACUT_11397 [Fusarium acutatum]|uniref:Uncharacterized protein n=1 Tax=Fusarium acutatum TaxID=78861 RepID=A0A8H4JHE1_9HYPO|nr:hypothetical protein FACUT_11397 [Fusarium acutatum]
MAYRQDDHERTLLASDSQANDDAAYEDYMRRYQARNPNSNWEPKKRRMVGPVYNPTPWLSPTSPEYPLTPFREWGFDPFVVSDGYRVVPRLPLPHESPRVEPQRVERQIRRNPDEIPQWEYVPGEGYRQVEPGTSSGAKQQHYSRSANEQRRENERRSYQVDRKEHRDTRMDPSTNARAAIPDMWTVTPEAREWMGKVQREVNLRGVHTRFPGDILNERRF